MRAVNYFLLDFIYNYIDSGDNNNYNVYQSCIKQWSFNSDDTNILSILQCGTLFFGAKAIDLLKLDKANYIICFFILIVIWTITDALSIPFTGNYIFIAPIIFDIFIVMMTRKMLLVLFSKFIE